MKNCLVLFLISLFSTANAQIGVSAGYKIMPATEWSEAFAANPSAFNGLEVAVDYWFRLKNKRIEFLPELSYERYTNNHRTERDELRFYNFFLNTNFYLLDFEGDCNCPTFSKGGNIFEKGFFVQISPGVMRFSSEAVSQADFLDPEQSQSSDSSTHFGIRLGAGLDIGITDFITLTPLARYTFIPSIGRDDFGQKFLGDASQAETQLGQLFAGVRLGFRWDN